MRLMFWNVRGLGMMHKRGLILKHILQEGLDLVAVQETIRQGFSDKELKEMGVAILLFGIGSQRGDILGVSS